jgi:hypothetical protein
MDLIRTASVHHRDGGNHLVEEVKPPVSPPFFFLIPFLAGCGAGPLKGKLSSHLYGSPCLPLGGRPP